MVSGVVRGMGSCEGILSRSQYVLHSFRGEVWNLETECNEFIVVLFLLYI